MDTEYTILQIIHSHINISLMTLATALENNRTTEHF